VNQSQRSTAKSFKLPLIHEKTPLTADQLNKRVPGINPYAPYGQAQALAYHSTLAVREMVGKVQRTIEHYASEALLSGTITLSGTESIDFHKKTAHSVTPGTKWDNSGDPITDIRSLADTIYQNGKMKPNVAIFGSAAWNAFINNATVQSYMDTRFIEPGRIAPGEVVDGMHFWGRLGIGQHTIDLYIYDGFYEADDGTATEFMTTDGVILANRQARMVKVFGAVEVLPEYIDSYMENVGVQVGGLIADRYVPYLYSDGERQSRVVGVQSAPLPVPVAIDTMGALDNVDT